MVDDLAPAARYLNATTDDTGPALLTALLLEVKTAKLVDLAPTGFATHDEELRSLLPPEWETAPGTLGPAATGPTATAAGVLRRSASGSAARGAWQPSDGPRLNARSPQQRKKGLHQNTRWGEGDQHEALRRLHPDRHPDRAEAVAHTHPRVVVHSVQYRGEAKAAPSHRNAAAQRAASQRSDPRLMVFDNSTVVASRILSEHAKAGARRRPASARAAQRMPDDLATRMGEAGLPKRYLHALRGMGFVYVEQLLALGRSLSLTERYLEVRGGPRSCTAPPLDQVLDTAVRFRVRVRVRVRVRFRVKVSARHDALRLHTCCTHHTCHTVLYCTAPTAPTRCSTRSTSRPDTACCWAADSRGWQGTARPI